MAAAAADAMANHDGRYMNDLFIRKHEFGNHMVKPKVLMDLSYVEAAVDAGKTPAESIQALEENGRIYGTRCSRMAIFNQFGDEVLPHSFNIENCLHEGMNNPQTCLELIVGAENPRSYVYATKTNMVLAQRVHGLPVVTITDEGHALYLAPTEFQVAFARDTPDKVIKLKKKGEKTYMKNWIRHSKKRGL